MNTLVRFGVSIEEQLLRRFDEFITRTGQENRSEAVRDLIRSRLMEASTRDDGALAFGVLTLVYDHHHRDLQERLGEVQHDNTELIVSTLHVHVDHDSCLEVIILKGRAGRIRGVCDALGGFKGVRHSRLTLTMVHE
jgi:CopG family transcriptional regulator, nickel-responsive regulator